MDAFDGRGCQGCAACCFSESERHVRVTGDDYERLGSDAEELVVFLGNQAFLALSSGAPRRCAALGVDAAGQFSCTIYDRRPTICRELERGGAACLGEIATKGDRPARWGGSASQPRATAEAS